MEFIPTYNKKCRCCGENKQITEFYLKKGKYYSSYCRTCEVEKAKKKNKKNSKKCTFEQSRRNTLRSKFNLSIEDYNKLFELQGGKCAICRKHQSELRKSLSVDHCHNTMKIRGLLCNNCNAGIGLLQDNKEVIEAALWYLTFNK